MFVGNFKHGVDDKGRFIMPLKFRTQLDGKLIATIGLDPGSLYLYSTEAWEELMLTFRTLSNAKKDIRTLQRKVMKHAETVEIDKQGRCLLSQELRDFAEIKDGVRLIGMDNKIELWSNENWQCKDEEEEEVDISEIAENLDIYI